MFRTLLRLIVALILVAAAAAFFLGYRWGDGRIERPATSGDAPVDATRAREAGAEIGERVAEGANSAQRILAEAALTAKIKSKMALDDTVKARTIDVDTRDGVATLSGRVGTQAERAKAVQLTRETEGVTSVVDRLTVSP